MVEMKVNDLLAQMQSMARQAQSSPVTETANVNKVEFSDLLKTSLDKVSDVQKNAGELAKSFEMGDKDVDITEVMVNLQKANVSFQAMTQVRNRLVSAYQEIMNMQV